MITHETKHYFSTPNHPGKFERHSLAFPIPSDLGDFKVSISEAAEGFQILDSSLLNSNFRIYKSENGESSIGLSDDAVVLRSGKTMITLTSGKITMSGKQVNMNLPNANYVIGEEVGILDFLPKCFLPGFNTPRLWPNIDLLTAATKIVDTVSKLKKGA